MHPFLWQWQTPWGTITIAGFGLMLALGLLAAAVLMATRAKRWDLTAEAVLQSLPWVMLGALVGAKALYCIYVWPQFLVNPWALVFYPGGLVWYGGVLAACGVLGCFSRWSQVSLLYWTDLYASGALVGLVFGRLGCLLAGCCYGCPVEASVIPWAVVYPPSHVTYPLAVHPTPVYESVGALVWLVVLLVLEKRYLRISGQWTSAFLVGYGLLRFGLEFLRGDRLVVPWEVVWGPVQLSWVLSSSQWISLVGILMGLVLWFRLKQKVTL
ncbi:MAG: prolipoprotein diacylglyceryl transferase family protein [Vampirovibrionales bacterium]